MLHPNNLFLSTRLIFALFPALHPYLSKALEHRPRVPRARDGARRVLLAQRKFVRRRAEETPVHLRPRWRGAALLAAGNIFGVVLSFRVLCDSLAACSHVTPTFVSLREILSHQLALDLIFIHSSPPFLPHSSVLPIQSARGANQAGLLAVPLLVGGRFALGLAQIHRHVYRGTSGEPPH